MDDKKSDPHETLKRADEVLSKKTLEDKLQTYYIEFVCFEKTGEIKGTSEPKFYEIPGKYTSYKQAKEVYKKQYEGCIKNECKGKFSELWSIKILSEKGWKNRITKLTISKKPYTIILRKPKP